MYLSPGCPRCSQPIAIFPFCSSGLPKAFLWALTHFLQCWLLVPQAFDGTELVTMSALNATLHSLSITCTTVNVVTIRIYSLTYLLTNLGCYNEDGCMAIEVRLVSRSIHVMLNMPCLQRVSSGECCADALQKLVRFCIDLCSCWRLDVRGPVKVVQPLFYFITPLIELLVHTAIAHPPAPIVCGTARQVHASRVVQPQHVLQP